MLSECFVCWLFAAAAHFFIKPPLGHWEMCNHRTACLSSCPRINVPFQSIIYITLCQMICKKSCRTFDIMTCDLFVIQAILHSYCTFFGICLMNTSVISFNVVVLYCNSAATATAQQQTKTNKKNSWNILLLVTQEAAFTNSVYITFILNNQPRVRCDFCPLSLLCRIEKW